MASLLREIARRSSKNIAKSATPQAWETTANLRTQYMYTTMDAMPARVEEAAKEWAALRNRISTREFTINDVTTGIVRAGELYAFYLFGKVIGGRTLANS